MPASLPFACWAASPDRSGGEDPATVREDILPLVATGRSDAVEECIDRYGGLIRGMARRFLSSAADVDDAVQDVFVALWRHAERFDPTVAAEATFVAMITRRRLIDRRRRSARHDETVALSQGAEVLEAPRVTSAPELADEVERVHGALRQLGDERRRVLEMSIHGHTHLAIAARLGLPIGTVKSHARRALLHVRSLLTGSGRGSSVGAGR